MSNGTLSQSQFRYQRPQASIYRVGPDQFYTTIQAAIDAAVADGYTTALNSATVEIYPKALGASYVENVTLKAGVNLQGIGLNGVVVEGNATYSTAGGTRADNTIFVQGVNLTCTSGDTLTVSGSNPLQLIFQNGATLETQAGGAGVCLSYTATSGNARVRFNAGSSINCNVVGGTAVSITGSGGPTLEFRQRNTTIFSSNGTDIAVGILIGGTGGKTVRVFGCDNFMNGGFSTACINMTSTSASANLNFIQSILRNTTGDGIIVSGAAYTTVQFERNRLETTAAGKSVFVTNIAGGIIRARSCVIGGDSGGNIGRGSAAGTISLGGNVYFINSNVQAPAILALDNVTPVQV